MGFSLVFFVFSDFSGEEYSVFFKSSQVGYEGYVANVEFLGYGSCMHSYCVICSV